MPKRRRSRECEGGRRRRPKHLATRAGTRRTSWARAPSSSRQTIPISSVTLAWRTLVTTLNLWLNSQITGVVIIFGGYINQSRVFCGELFAPDLAGADFFLGLAAMLLMCR